MEFRAAEDTQKGLTCAELKQQLEWLQSLKLMEEALETKRPLPHLNKVTGGGTTSVGGGNDAGGNRFSGWNTGRRGLAPGLDITKL